MFPKTMDISTNSREYQNYNTEIKYNPKTEQQNSANKHQVSSVRKT